MDESFSEETASTVPTSTEDMFVESNSPLSDKDGDNTNIERLPFTRIQIASESYEAVTSPFRNSLVRQESLHLIVQLATDSDSVGKTILFEKGVKTT